jgi:S-adenosylmethionine:tRNA ribosyltransferase-isomerase
MDVSLFDFKLPEGRIALRPADPRDSARLLVVRANRELEHARICDLPDLLAPADVLVANDTKVIHARLRGRREPRGGIPGDGPTIEVLLHKRIGPRRFHAFVRPVRKLLLGDRLRLGQTLQASVVARQEAGQVEIEFALSGADLDAGIAREGTMPLPPYIARKREIDARDAEDYQTLFARRSGSVAAPTAGLHFTPELLTRLSASGVTQETITLHVGAGTFLPVTAGDTREHRMHAERASLDGATARRINAIRQSGGRIVAVGTTSLRTLESAAQHDGRLAQFSSETDIFITPGYKFRTADVLLTNFHLPRSTLFMLVCAFMGTDLMKSAYAEAIREDYRFYSYGDACLLFRPEQ